MISDKMECINIDAPEEWGDIRGPDLVRWITDSDLRFSGIENVYGPARGDIMGALSHNHWVLFHGLQVIKIIPDEVHSAWHYDFMHENEEFSSAWKIDNSQWIKTFNPRHLENHSHFLIRFYDDVIEVICKELIFGVAPFELKSAIEKDPQLSYSYFQLAESHKKAGQTDSAITHYKKYLTLSSGDSDSIDYVQKCIKQLK